MKIILIKEIKNFNEKLKELSEQGYYLNSSKEIKKLESFNIPKSDKDLIFSENLKYMVIYMGLYEKNSNRLAWDYILKEDFQISGTSLSQIVKQFPRSKIEVI